MCQVVEVQQTSSVGEYRVDVYILDVWDVGNCVLRQE